MQSQDYAALVAARICHDVISPVGAITNGLELVELTGGPIGPELELIRDSTRHAEARLRFFRVAFGMPSAGAVSAPDATALLQEMSETARFDLKLSLSGEIPRVELQLVCLAVMCLETALAFGGTLSLSRGAEGYALTARAARLRQDPALWAILEGTAPQGDIPPALVQFPLLALHSSNAARRCRARLTETEASVRF